MENQVLPIKSKSWLNRNILGMGLTSLFSDMNHEMASAVLPIFLASVLGAPAFSLGLIEGVSDGVSTLFEVWSGWYSDRIGKRKGLAAFGFFILAFSEASIALTTNWYQVLIARTMGWIGWSVRTPIQDALLLESTTPATVSRAFAFHGVMDTLGAIAGPLIATLLLSHVSIRIIFLVSLIPGICAFLSILIFVKEKVRVRNETKVWQSIRSLSPNFISFLIPVGIFGISNFAPTLLILRAQELLTPAHGALLAGTFAVALYTWSNVAYAIVSYPISVLADKYSKKAILSIGYLLFGVLCFGFVFASSSLWFLILLFAVSGIYTAIIEPSEPALASTFLSEDQHGTGYGTLSSVQGVGDFLSSITVGILWTFLSPTYGFLFAGVLAVIAGVMMFRKI
jgi:MFS family permease